MKNIQKIGGQMQKTRIALFLRHKIIHVATYPHRCVVFYARRKIKRVRFVFLPTQAVREAVLTRSCAKSEKYFEYIESKRLPNGLLLCTIITKLS
ncbi:MAG: hypothetical protein ACI4MZ_06765 [Christensenellales bacterium]